MTDQADTIKKLKLQVAKPNKRKGKTNVQQEEKEGQEEEEETEEEKVAMTKEMKVQQEPPTGTVEIKTAWNDEPDGVKTAPTKRKSILEHTTEKLKPVIVSTQALVVITVWCLIPLTLYFFVFSGIGWGAATYKRSMELENLSFYLTFGVVSVLFLLWILDMPVG